MNGKNIPDYILERYILDELPPERMKLIVELMREDPAIERRIAEIKKSSAQILRRYAPEAMVPGIIKRAGDASLSGSLHGAKRIPRRYYIIPSLAAAAILIIMVALPLIKGGFDSDWNPFMKDVTRIKGPATAIYIYRKKKSDIELLADNSLTGEKDLLQVAYFSADETHGVIVSIDGRRTVTLHYPAPPSKNTRIERNRKVLLPSAYELDNATGFERFIFVTSRHPVEIRVVYRAAEQLANNPSAAKTRQLTLDASFHQTSLLLRKE
jgi:hypothetical protein